MSIYHPDIHKVVDGQTRPTADMVAKEAEDNTITAPPGIPRATHAQRQANYDHTDHERFAILSAVMEEP